MKLPGTRPFHPQTAILNGERPGAPLRAISRVSPCTNTPYSTEPVPGRLLSFRTFAGSGPRCGHPWRRVPRAGPQTCHKSATALSRENSNLATEILRPATAPRTARKPPGPPKPDSLPSRWNEYFRAVPKTFPSSCRACGEAPEHETDDGEADEGGNWHAEGDAPARRRRTC
jgi:hypothetical protein